jgi:trichothecene 3-O-acetyltransferase
MPGPEDLNDSLNVFEQQPGLNQLYTQMCFCFPVATSSSHPAIINTLTEGLKRLSETFPWVAGQIVNEGASEGNTGLFKIKPLEKIPRLVVKDLRNDPSIPTMDEFRRANFPLVC